MIEITRGDSAHTYRICPTDSRTIERRENRHNARWCFYLRRDTANEAKTALLKLETKGETE